VDVAAHRIKIAHGPIDALGWPGMNMEFEADHGVDLSELRPGQDLRFQLRQADSGRFVIIAATPRDSGDEVTSPELIESLEAGEAGEKRAQPEHQHD
jgi:hypothetical protein